MKTDKNFRMQQSTKRLLAQLDCAHQRGGIRRAMISAQVTSEHMSRRASRREAKGE